MSCLLLEFFLMHTQNSSLKQSSNWNGTGRQCYRYSILLCVFWMLTFLLLNLYTVPWLSIII